MGLVGGLRQGIAEGGQLTHPPYPMYPVLQLEMTGEGIAKRAEKVAAFYKKRGQPVFSPLVSALDDISN